MTKLNKKLTKQIKKILLAQKSDIISLTNQDTEIDMEGDETDIIQAKMLLEMHKKLNNRASNKLQQIEEALKRIDNQTYGLCQDCEELIPEKRLLANPHFQTCVSCAEDREVEDKRRTA